MKSIKIDFIPFWDVTPTLVGSSMSDDPVDRDRIYRELLYNLIKDVRDGFATIPGLDADGILYSISNIHFSTPFYTDWCIEYSKFVSKCLADNEGGASMYWRWLGGVSYDAMPINMSFSMPGSVASHAWEYFAAQSVLGQNRFSVSTSPSAGGVAGGPFYTYDHFSNWIKTGGSFSNYTFGPVPLDGLSVSGIPQQVVAFNYTDLVSFLWGVDPNKISYYQSTEYLPSLGMGNYSEIRSMLLSYTELSNIFLENDVINRPKNENMSLVSLPPIPRDYSVRIFLQLSNDSGFPAYEATGRIMNDALDAIAADSGKNENMYILSSSRSGNGLGIVGYGGKSTYLRSGNYSASGPSDYNIFTDVVQTVKLDSSYKPENKIVFDSSSEFYSKLDTLIDSGIDLLGIATAQTYPKVLSGSVFSYVVNRYPLIYGLLRDYLVFSGEIQPVDTPGTGSFTSKVDVDCSTSFGQQGESINLSSIFNTHGTSSEFASILSSLPSASCCHFRLSFYTNKEMTHLFHDTFSLLSSKRWLLDNTCIPGSSGFYINKDQFPVVTYAPDINNNGLYKYTIENGGISESPLISGVTYYVIASAYYDDTFYHIANFEFTPSLGMTSNRWSMEKSVVNDSYAVRSHLDAGVSSILPVVWQDSRSGVPSSFLSLYNHVDEDMQRSFYGNYEVNIIPKSYCPHVNVDHLGNCIVSAISNDRKFIIVNPFVFDNAIKSTMDGGARLDAKSISAKVVDKYIRGTVSLGESILPSVGIPYIEMDVVGLPHGVISYSVMREDSISWSDWQKIDAPDEVKYGSIFTNSNLRSVLIPVELSPFNGLKAICVRFLTYQGITDPVCIRLMANYDIVSYNTILYLSGTTTPIEPGPGGFAIGAGEYTLQISTSDVGYIRRYQSSGCSVPVVVDIIRDNKMSSIYNKPLVYQGNGIWSATISIPPSDGVIYKDGRVTLNVRFPFTGSSLYSVDSHDSTTDVNRDTINMYYSSDINSNYLTKRINIDSKIHILDKSNVNYIFGRTEI